MSEVKDSSDWQRFPWGETKTEACGRGSWQWAGGSRLGAPGRLQGLDQKIQEGGGMPAKQRPGATCQKTTPKEM